MKKTLRAAGLFSLALATLIGPAQIHAQCVGCSQSAIQQPVFRVRQFNPISLGSQCLFLIPTKRQWYRATTLSQWFMVQA